MTDPRYYQNQQYIGGYYNDQTSSYVAANESYDPNAYMQYHNYTYPYVYDPTIMPNTTTDMEHEHGEYYAPYDYSSYYTEGTAVTSYGESTMSLSAPLMTTATIISAPAKVDKTPTVPVSVAPQISSVPARPVSTAVFNPPGISFADPTQKKRKILRAAGGEIWNDPTLEEWPENDYRIFCGDLGNDVSDEVLARAFMKYSSFQLAKIVREKRTNKSKGYGFVSFSDPHDFLKAMKEMNGKYIGNRPVKLRKSTWDERNVTSKEVRILKKELPVSIKKAKQIR